MSGCNHGFKMIHQVAGFKLWLGLRGADGKEGPPGPPGPGVKLRGPIASVADLPASASSSELWLVGAASPYDGWFYNGVQWESSGQIAVGPPGPAGQDGVSPGISITDITGGHRVTITDAEHPQGLSFDVLDGEDGSPGQPGTPGTPGAPGVSPEVSVETITGGHRVTITDAEHPQGQTFDVMDGEDGSPGQPGTPGAPGVSPEVSVETITGGHRVTITDAEHPQGQTFDVMDGASTAFSPTKIVSAASYSIVADDAGKTIIIDAATSTVTLTSEISTALPIGTEIAMLASSYSTAATITLTLPSRTGRAYGASDAFTTVKLTGGFNMYAIKKLWNTGWLVTGADLEVVT